MCKEQVLQTYQALTSQTTPSALNRYMITHIIYHVDKALQSKYESLVDRGANVGLEGSNLRILSKSQRECNAISIHHDILPDLDIVLCAALVQAQ